MKAWEERAKERHGRAYRPKDPDFWYACGYIDGSKENMDIETKQQWWDRSNEYPTEYQMGFLDGQTLLPEDFPRVVESHNP
jgi:hypothetical protein